MREDLVRLSADFSRVMCGLRAEFLASPTGPGPHGAAPEPAKSAGRVQDHARLAAAPFSDAGSALVSLSIVELDLRGWIPLRADFFMRTVLDAGGFGFCLDAIENGILRGNRRPSSWPMRPFGARDQRRAFAVAVPDFRLHFALNFGAASAPALGLYSAESLGIELARAQADFSAEHFRPDPTTRTLGCSPLFRWNRRDFPDAWLQDPAYRSWKRRYERFDWTAAPG